MLRGVLINFIVKSHTLFAHLHDLRVLESRQHGGIPVVQRVRPRVQPARLILIGSWALASLSRLSSQLLDLRYDN